MHRIRPPRPSSRNGIRLPSLGPDAPAPGAGAAATHGNSAATAAQPTPWGPGACPVVPDAAAHHLATLRSLRRSAPQAPWERAIFGLVSQPGPGWGIEDPAAASEAGASSASAAADRPVHQAVRVRRNRRPADFGAPLGQQESRSHPCRAHSAAPSSQAATLHGGAASMLREGHCFAPQGPHQVGGIGSSGAGSGDGGATAAALAGVGGPASPKGAARSASVPPTGTSKADDDASARGKARAVAMLQKLFFEEMAKGGQDANSAAAAALRRLSEINVPLDVEQPEPEPSGPPVQARAGMHNFASSAVSSPSSASTSSREARIPTLPVGARPAPRGHRQPGGCGRPPAEPPEEACEPDLESAPEPSEAGAWAGRAPAMRPVPPRRPPSEMGRRPILRVVVQS